MDFWKTHKTLGFLNVLEKKKDTKISKLDLPHSFVRQMQDFSYMPWWRGSDGNISEYFFGQEIAVA
jgi:hypothetical protein